MWELVKELAVWTGWFPITIGAAIVMLLGRYFYDREIKFKDTQIIKLKDDLEASKQFQVDVLVQNLSHRTKVLTEELERLNGEVTTENHKRNQIEQEKITIQEQLDLTQSDALKLRERLEQLEDELDNLLGIRAEPDICRVCDVDDEHVLMNTIYWGGKSGRLVGDTDLVKEGVCSYCASINLKCKVCGEITGINPGVKDVVECEGCYHTLYTPLSFFSKKSDNKIKVSRRASE